MPKKKKFPKGKSIVLADFFGMHHEPAVNSGYSSDDELDERRAWVAERDRQKTISREAATLGQQKAQIAVLLGEEHDHRANLIKNEERTRTNLQEDINEQRVIREWAEFKIAQQEEYKQQECVKKVPFSQIATKQMFHRADIADKETKSRLSFFDSFAASANKAKEAEKARGAQEKLEADRKKAADRAKAYEERTRKATTEKSSLFQLVDAPAEPAAETKQASGWLSGWFSKP